MRSFKSKGGISHFRHFLGAFKFSLAGLWMTLKEEKAFQQICLFACACIPCAILLADSWLEAIILIIPIALAIIVELLNTAIENITDLASPDWHRLAKRAKDCGSAAQFCSQLLILGVWASWLWKKYL